MSSQFVRGLGLFDSTMIVAGSMIGSGIFIVSADIARLVVDGVDSHRRADGPPGLFFLAAESNVAQHSCCASSAV